MTQDHTAFTRPGRIEKRIERLAGFTEPDRPYTRLVFSPEYAEARDWLRSAFEEANLACRMDGGGNIIGTRPARGRKAGSAKVVVGSHIDTVPAGGRFDGIAGVLAALEVAHYMEDNRVDLPFDLEVVDFLGEELNDWSVSCIGSRHMAGLLDAEMLARDDGTGRILGDEIARAGGGAPSEGPRADAESIKACFELHIEQAATLEQRGVDIGVVTAIPGIHRHAITVGGTAGHSGTTAMAGRRDALVAAADIIRDVSELATAAAAGGNRHFVATIGRIEVHPNGPAVVPGQVAMVLDLRAEAAGAEKEYLESLRERFDSVREARGCDIGLERLASNAPAPMDEGLRRVLADSAAALGLSHMDVPSGAGHDMAHMSRIAPAAMVFIPCRDGRSHCPEEFATTEAIAKGAAVLARGILELAESA